MDNPYSMQQPPPQSAPGRGAPAVMWIIIVMFVALVGVVIYAIGQALKTEPDSVAPVIWSIKHPSTFVPNAISADGRIALSDGGEEAWVWEVSSGRMIQRFVLGGNVSTLAALSPDGKRVAAGDNDGYIDVWDAETGDRLRRFRLHTEWIGAIFYLADSRRAVSSSGDGTMRISDLETGEELRRIEIDEEYDLIAVSPDEQWALTANWEDGEHVRSMQTGQRHRKLNLPSDAYVMSARFSSDSRRLIVAADEAGIYIFDVESGDRVLHIDGGDYWFDEALFSGDGRRLISRDSRWDRRFRFLPNLIDPGLWTYGVQVWDADSGELITEWRFRSTQGTTFDSMALTPDDATLLLSDGAGTIQAWDLNRAAEPSLPE